MLRNDDFPMRKNLLIALVAGSIALASAIAAYKHYGAEAGPTTKTVSAKTATD